MSENKPPVMEAAQPASSRLWWWLTLAVCAAGVLVLYLFAPEKNAFYPQCFFRQATGWDCPGCGGLRAAHQLLHGNFSAAWHLNPLAVLLVPLLTYETVIRLPQQRTWPSVLSKPFASITIALLFLAFGIWRNLPAGIH